MKAVQQDKVFAKQKYRNSAISPIMKFNIGFPRKLKKNIVLLLCFLFNNCKRLFNFPIMLFNRFGIE